MSEQIKRHKIRTEGRYVEMVDSADHEAALADKDARISELERRMRPMPPRNFDLTEQEQFIRRRADEIFDENQADEQADDYMYMNEKMCREAAAIEWGAMQALASQQQAEPLIDTSAWQSCNPGCDPEFNGEKSRHCSCEPAKVAIAEQQADPTMAKNANVAATPSEDGGEVPKLVLYSPYAASDRAGNTWGEMSDEPDGEWLHVAQHSRIVAAKDAEIARLENDLNETELRALKFIHQCNAHVDLYRELRAERDELRAQLDAQPARQVGVEVPETDQSIAADCYWHIADVIGTERNWSVQEHVEWMKELLQQASDYLHDIPESAVGGCDAAVELCRRLRLCLVGKAPGYLGDLPDYQTARQVIEDE